MKRVKNNILLSKTPVVLEASKKSSITPKSQAPASKAGKVSKETKGTKGTNAKNITSAAVASDAISSVSSVPSVSSSASYLKPELLTIQQVSEKLGVATKTLRRWEAKGVIKPQRTIGNQRRYTLADIEALKTGTRPTVSKSTTSSTDTTSITSSKSKLPRGTRDTLDTRGTTTKSPTHSPTAGKRYFTSSGAGLGSSSSSSTSSVAGSNLTRLTPDQAAAKFDLDRSHAKSSEQSRSANSPEQIRRVHVQGNGQGSTTLQHDLDSRLNSRGT